MTDSLRILIVDDDRLMAKTLADILRIKGYTVTTAHTGEGALNLVEAEAFDCVLTDVKMPGINGVDLYLSIKALKPALPVVLMTAYTAESLLQRGLEAGALAVLGKPLDISALLAFFAALGSERTVVIVDDDENFARTLRDILQQKGFAVAAADPHSVLDTLQAETEVVLLDMKLNSITGLDVLREIKQHQPELPVILVTGYGAEMSSAVEAAVEIGAYTCLHKPLEIDLLLQYLDDIHRHQLSRTLADH